MGIQRVTSLVIACFSFKFSLLLAQADTRIFQATGSKPEDLQPIIDQFKQAISLGGGNNGYTPTLMPNGRREIDFNTGTISGPKSDLSIPPAGFGLSAGPGMTLLLSKPQLGPDDPNRNLGDFNPTFTNTFQPFGSSRILADAGTAGNFLVISFLPPMPSQAVATDIRFGVTGFGAVFTDVDLTNSTSMTIGSTIHPAESFLVPAAPGNGNFTFFGVVFDEPRSTIQIFPGNTYVSPNANDGDSTIGGGIIDYVALNEIIYSEPRPVPEPSVISLVFLTLSGMAVARLRPPGQRREPSSPISELWC